MTKQRGYGIWGEGERTCGRRLGDWLRNSRWHAVLLLAGLTTAGLLVSTSAEAQGDSSEPSKDWSAEYDKQHRETEVQETTTTTTTTTIEQAPPPEVVDDEKCLPSCEPGFECRQGQCESMCSPPCGASEVCTGSGFCQRLGEVGQHIDEAAKRRAEHRRETTLSGVRGIAGLVLGGGITLHGEVPEGADEMDDPSSHGAWYAGLKAGVMLDVIELSAEYAPLTFRPVSGGREGVRDRNTFIQSLLLNGGIHIPMVSRVHWPIRAGVGFIAEDGEFDLQGRLDLLNISVKTKYFLFDASFPSLRYMSDLDQFHRFTALFTVGASYITP